MLGKTQKLICSRVAVITATDSSSALQQIQAASPVSDVIELRLDYWSSIDIESVALLREKISLPVIFTLRKSSQGGQCHIPENQRLLILQQLATLSPEYVDIEYDTAPAWLNEFRDNHPHIQLIGSYHDFSNTPDDLNATFLPLLSNPHFDVFKIATFARNICDSLRLMIFVKSVSRTYPLIGIAMGEYGQISRILAPIVGSLFTYGCLTADSCAAPGQLTLTELTEIYRLPLLNSDTAIYALLGDPIEQSAGHLFHNQAFASLHKNAVYVKCRVNAEILASAMALFRQLPFYGFSVTIPHKETVVAFIDELQADAAAMRIVNTIECKQQRYLGFNTDAIGAASVLAAMRDLQNQRVLILGAGGSGKAIAYVLLANGAKVTLCNRTLQRAQEFTQQFGGDAIDFATLFAATDFPYDIIINTLPLTAFAQQCANWTIPPAHDGIAMDIILKPLLTPFIQSAQAAGWRCLTGDALFTAQAELQLKIWGN